MKELSNLAVSIVILAIIVSVGAIVLFNVSKTSVTNFDTNLIKNESVTGGVATLSEVWVKDIAIVINSSNNVIIASPNYTLSVDPDTGVGTISNSSCVADDDLCVGEWKVSYNVYDLTDVRYSASNKAMIGIGTYGDWIKIIVLVSIAGLILWLITRTLGERTSTANNY